MTAATYRRGSSPEALTFGRQAWRGLVDLFRDAAAEVLAGGVLDAATERTLRGSFRRAGGTVGEHADAHRRARLADIPVEGISAGPARDAFAAAVAGFLLSAGERRSRFARLLVAACDLVDGLLVEAGHAAGAATWRRHLKEED